MKILLSDDNQEFELHAVQFKHDSALFKSWGKLENLPIYVVYYSKHGAYSSDTEDLILINNNYYCATDLLIGTYLLFY